VAEDREGQRGFTVKDRRRFSETGEARDEGAAPPEPPPSAAEAARPPEPDAASAAPGGAAREPHAETREPVTFSTFLLGLSTQALLYLGEIPNPVSRAVETDLDAARQVIDILGVLQAKTRNNLEPDEQGLLESVLYDLRMRYVELRRTGAKGGR
jgi:hypothetical protein